jgi:tyrosine-specific transport protein
MSEFKKFVLATATLTSTIIGVGFFSLPYITNQVGLLTMLGYFLVLGGLVILIHLLFGEVALKTPDFLRLPGYAKIHLGERGKQIAVLTMILGTYGSILAYLIIGGKFLSSLSLPFLAHNEFLATLVYFLLGSIFIYLGIKSIAKLDFWSLLLVLVIMAVVFLKGLPFLRLPNVLVRDNFLNFFLPYGPILFSLWGASMIPEIEEMLGQNKNLLKRVIFTSVLISALVYLFFIFMVLGISGPLTTIDAISGLKGFLGGKTLVLGLLLGLVTSFTSFLALGLTLRKVFSYDLGFNKNLAFLLVCLVPLAMFLAGLQDFLKVISLVGGVMLGVEGTLILLMYNKIKPEKKWLIYPLILIFLLGIGYEIVYFVK